MPRECVLSETCWIEEAVGPGCREWWIGGRMRGLAQKQPQASLHEICHVNHPSETGSGSLRGVFVQRTAQGSRNALRKKVCHTALLK